MNSMEKALKIIGLSNKIVDCPDCQKTAFNDKGILKEGGWKLLCEKHQRERDELDKEG